MTPYNGGFDGHTHTGLEHETTGALIGELVGEAKLLVREEVRLAKSELRNDVKEAGAGVAFFGAAGVLGNGAFFCFVAALVFGLAYLMPLWLAAFAVGVLLAGTAAMLGAIGGSRFKKVGFDETMEMVKEDGQWASETMRAARSVRHADA